MAAAPTHEPPNAVDGPTGQEEQELAFGQVWKDAAKAPPRRTTVERPATERRKSSIQFHTADAEDTIRRESVTQGSRTSLSQRRMSSPPPPFNYQRGVSFDTLDNRDASTEAFTLNYKHRDYASTSRSRTFLCGTDAKDYSEYALEWMLDELIDDGDEIVCLRVVEKDTKTAHETPYERSKYRDEAQKLLDSVIKKNSAEEKAISIIMELAVGKVQEIFQRMIGLYEPAALVVGTRGRNLGGMQGLLPGSVSKYCLQHSPVPVIVVRPTSKRLKKKMKRQLETGRSLYSSMLEKAQTAGGSHLFDKRDNSSISMEATEKEADAVARAIGPPRRGILKGTYGGPLARVTSARSDATSDDESPERGFTLPIGYFSTESAPRADLAMQFPSIAALQEDWDDEDLATPKKTAKATGKRHESRDSDAAISDTEEGSLGVRKIVDERRPSVRETTPWLEEILRDKPQRRSPSHGRSPSR
ncbi:Universal stress protein A family protein [Exophiala dermatitidis]